jgi:predicted NUDIX family NTP pyrophosphohydrolase
VAKQSAGGLLYRTTHGATEVLLVYPGGPFRAPRHRRVVESPKGECEHGEDPRACALGELEEETGTALSPVELIELGSVRQRGGKVQSSPLARPRRPRRRRHPKQHLHDGVACSLGTRRRVPRDRLAAWFDADAARGKLVAAQAAFVDRLLERLR